MNTRFRIIILGTIVVILLINRIRVSAQDSLSLHECIIYTLEHNVNSTIYRNNTAIAVEKIREYKARLLPSISSSVNLDYNPKLQVTVIPPGLFGDKEAEFTMGNRFASKGTVDVEQVLLNRAYIQDIKSAKIDNRIAELEVQRQNEKLIYNTIDAYYKVLSRLEERNLLTENEKRNIEVENLIKLNYQQGDAKYSDYRRAIVNRKNIQSELAQKESEYAQALNALKNNMGMDINTPAIIRDTTVHNIQVQLPDDMDFNVTGLPDYQIDLQNLQQKKLNLKQKRSANWPILSAYGTYGANAYGSELSKTYNRLYDYGLVGMKLSIPIFSGFARNSQVRQSMVGIQNQELTNKLNEREYHLTFQNTRTELVTAYYNLEKNLETMNMAKDLLDATTLGYQHGEATYNTFLDDEFAYHEARTNYANSVISFLNARLSLEKAKGNLVNYLNSK